MDVNLALLENNAALAADIACALGELSMRDGQAK
jgi:pseudouridine-5'-phosphate glycosidase